MPAITRTPTPFSYSTAVAAGDFVFLGLHRGFGPDFSDQLHSALNEVGRTLAAYELSLTDLVKVHVWLKNINDLPAMEQGFTDHFPADEFPARMTATTEFIDDDCLIMIEGVAYRAGGR